MKKFLSYLALLITIGLIALYIYSRVGYRIEQDPAYENKYSGKTEAITWLWNGDKIIKDWRTDLDNVTDSTLAQQRAFAEDFKAKLQGKKFKGIIHDTAYIHDTVFVLEKDLPIIKEFPYLSGARDIIFRDQITADASYNVEWSIWFDGSLLQTGSENCDKKHLPSVHYRLRVMANNVIHGIVKKLAI